MRLKKFTAGIVSLAMALTLIPASAFAAESSSYSGYVLMNIPYSEFYKADVNNDVAVDAFTSATLNKTRTGTLAAGSYHVDPNGTDITGVTFPVKVSESDLAAVTAKYPDAKVITDESSVSITVTNRGKTSTTTYNGSEALFENPSYSYYVLSSKPSTYKELTVENDTVSFGKVTGRKATIEDSSVSLTTQSSYGDYQISVEGITDYVNTSDKVYGVIISTKEGDSYGLRHMENIWRVSELSWCTGFTTSVHNCPTSSAHYKKMIGQTINQITYYTEKGTYVIKTDLAIPVKTAVTEYSTQVGDSFCLTPSASSYKSSDENVVKVETEGDNAGVVTMTGAGTATVDVTTSGRSGEVTTTHTFHVSAKPLISQTISVPASTIRKTVGDASFSLGAKAKTALSYASSNTKVASVDKNGKVNITGSGTAVITISAAANDTYAAATKKVTITVSPYKLAKQTVSLKAAGKKQMKISWKKNTKASGYEISYCLKKSFKGAKKVVIKNNKTISKTIKNLKSKKTYYVKVLSYKQLGKTKVYSSFSNLKKITVK